MHRIFMLLIVAFVSFSTLLSSPEPEDWTETGFPIKWWKKGLSVSYTGVCVSRDGKYLFARVSVKDSNSIKKEIQMWGLETKEIVRTMNPVAEIRGLHISPDFKTILCQNTQNSIIEFIDVESGESLWYGRPENNGDMFTWVYAASFIEETGDVALLTSGNNFIEIMNPRDQQQQYKIEFEESEVVTGVMSQNGKYFAGRFADTTVKVYNVLSGEKVSELHPSEMIYPLGISNDAEYIVYNKYTDDGGIYTGIFDFNTNTVIKELYFDIRYAEFTSDCKTLMLHSKNYSSPYLINLETPNILRKGKDKLNEETLTFLPGSSKYCGVNSERKIVITDANDINSTEILSAFSDQYHYGSVNGLALSADGGELASCSSDGQIKIWDAESGLLKNTIVVGDNLIDIEYSDDGEMLATGSTSNLYYFSTDTYQQTSQINNAINYIMTDIEFQPHSEYNDLAVCGWNGSINVWSPGGGQANNVDSAWAYVFCLSWSPDGALLAAGSKDKMVKVYQYDESAWSYPVVKEWTAEYEQKFSNQGMKDVEFSDDGKYLLTVSEGEMRPRLWNAQTFEHIKDFEVTSTKAGGPTGAVTFLHDNKKVALAAHQGKIFIWDIETAKEEYVFDTLSIYYKNATNSINSLILSKDGKYLYYSTSLGDMLKLDVSGIKIGVESEAENADEYRISPNPCSDYLRLSLPDNINSDSRIEILDMQGRSVCQELIDARDSIININVDYLSPGFYILSIRSGAVARNLQFIKR